MSIASLDDLISSGISGRSVFLRADLNVPLDGGRITDDTRIRASLPSLQRLLAAGARVVLASHLGRPRGERRSDLSLRPIAARLSELLGQTVGFADDCIGDDALRASQALSNGQVLLLENLRFYPGETGGDLDFAKELAGLADLYVGDAFGTAHRAHASTAVMVPLFESAAAGDLLQAELEHLRVVREPERPLVCFLGGAKVSDKLSVLEALAPQADTLAIGGAMAYTFLAARGHETGRSLVERDRLDDARRVEEAASAAGRELLLPVDHVVVETLAPDAPSRVETEVPEGWMGVDIGPATAKRYGETASGARTIFWNGPMGVFEFDAFACGTEALANAIAKSSATSVVGGGDSLAAVNKVGVGERISHLSTGGGAALEYIQGLELPGVAALER